MVELISHIVTFTLSRSWIGANEWFSIKDRNYCGVKGLENIVDSIEIYYTQHIIIFAFISKIEKVGNSSKINVKLALDDKDFKKTAKLNWVPNHPNCVRNLLI